VSLLLLVARKNPLILMHGQITSRQAMAQVEVEKVKNFWQSTTTIQKSRTNLNPNGNCLKNCS